MFQVLLVILIVCLVVYSLFSWPMWTVMGLAVYVAISLMLVLKREG